MITKSESIHVSDLPEGVYIVAGNINTWMTGQWTWTPYSRLEETIFNLQWQTDELVTVVTHLFKGTIVPKYSNVRLLVWAGDSSKDVKKEWKSYLGDYVKLVEIDPAITKWDDTIADLIIKGLLTGSYVTREWELKELLTAIADKDLAKIKSICKLGKVVYAYFVKEVAKKYLLGAEGGGKGFGMCPEFWALWVVTYELHPNLNPATVLERMCITLALSGRLTYWDNTKSKVKYRNFRLR